MCDKQQRSGFKQCSRNLGQSHRQGRSPSHFFFRRRQASQLLRIPYRVGFMLPPVGITSDFVVACPGCLVVEASIEILRACLFTNSYRPKSQHAYARLARRWLP